MPEGTFRIDQWICVAIALAIESNTTEQGVIHRQLVEVRVLSVVICEVELVLKENEATARTSFTICFVGKRIVRSEPFRGFATANPACKVILPVDHVVPKRDHSTLVIRVVRLSGDVCHTRIEVRGAHSMAYGFVLLTRWQVALVVLRAASAGVEKELRKRNICIS